MSPEPDKQIAETIAAKENVAPKMDEQAVITDNTIQSTSSTIIPANILQTSSASSANSNRPSRERRQQSPSSLLTTPDATLFDSIADAPVSPCSTSSADATFEPTIDMMVNDFDDEQTLNEEEALADQEAHNPDDEIATLREESEMPIEELLAKYGALDQAAEPPPRKKAKKCKRSKKRLEKEDREAADAKMSTKTVQENAQVQFSEYSPEEYSGISKSVDDTKSAAKGSVVEVEEEEEDEIEDEDDDMHALESSIVESPVLATAAPHEVAKTPQCRSHLLDLYPEGTFDGIVPAVHGQAEIFDELNGDDIEDAEEEEDAETDPDCFKKSVMVGPEYQAYIPEGLSQYGDMLPYENEDKLIWEPSQVSEHEVEEYLLKVREIKPTMSDEENAASDPSTLTSNTDIVEPINQVVAEKPVQEKIVRSIEDKIPNGTGAETNATEQNTVVKDNEQALHLLVQCGYDFKEALRRKRLNVLPLTSTMSLWSEDECSKFEEGIQKFGKDFLKIRQQLVRTRSMRELVQFYYLWKKSDRRDQNFANSDTVDHMDIYLNESTEYGPGNVVSGASGCTITVSASSHRKNSGGHHKNVSIMTKNAAAAQANAAAATTAVTATDDSGSTKLTHNRRRISLQENSTKIESSSGEQNVAEIK